jgi:cytochrome P450
VRNGLSRLSFNTLQGMRDIYGMKSKKDKVFNKTGFYTKIPGPERIFKYTDPIKHKAVRKMFAPSLSGTGVRPYEAVISNKMRQFLQQMRDTQSVTGSHGRQVADIIVNDLVERYVMDVVSAVLLGKEMSSLSSGQSSTPHRLARLLTLGAGILPRWAKEVKRVFYFALILDLFHGSGIPSLVRWIAKPYMKRSQAGKSSHDLSTMTKEYVGFQTANPPACRPATLLGPF